MPLKVKATNFVMEKLPSSAINSASVVPANYEAFGNTNVNFFVPDHEDINDAARAGRNAATQLCPTYWKQLPISIADDIDFSFFPKFLRRAMGGTPVKTTAATGVFDFTWGILNPSIGDALPATGIITRLGDAFFLWDGMTVSKIGLSQSGAERVQQTTDLVGTGKWTKDPFAVGSIPSFPSSPCSDGRGVTVTFYDPITATTIDLGSLGKILSWNMELDNLLKLAYRKLGDPSKAFTDTGQTVTAGYVRSIPRGNNDQSYQSVFSFVEEFIDLGEWNRRMVNRKLENLTIKIPGAFIANVSSVDYFNELEITIPSFAFETIEGGNQDGVATLPIGVILLEDPITKGTFTARYRTALTTFEGV